MSVDRKDRAGTDASRPAVRLVSVDTELAGQRIDNFLMQQLKGVPRSLVYKLLRRGEVRVNKGRVKPAHKLAAGDQVRLPPVTIAPREALPKPGQALVQSLQTRVRYDDGRVLVIDKPAGLAVHGGSGIRAGLIEALRSMHPGADLELVHRLDRETSGCLLVSQRRSALRALHAQMRAGHIGKRYLALLVGALPKAVVEVRLPLKKNQMQGGERMVQIDEDAGKPARTLFRRLRAYGDCTLAEVELDTGRTHQIRVHAASLGAPVAGDDKYGDAEANRRLRVLGLKRLFLHAASLAFEPPADSDSDKRGADRRIRVEAPLPEELEAVLQRLANES